MTPFTNFESRMIALPFNNVDTDQIIPARFLKTTSKQGLDSNSSTTGATTPRAIRTRSSC